MDRPEAAEYAVDSSAMSLSYLGVDLCGCAVPDSLIAMLASRAVSHATLSAAVLSEDR
jgi:hypothetical protein